MPGSSCLQTWRLLRRPPGPWSDWDTDHPCGRWPVFLLLAPLTTRPRCCLQRGVRSAEKSNKLATASSQGTGVRLLSALPSSAARLAGWPGGSPGVRGSRGLASLGLSCAHSTPSADRLGARLFVSRACALTPRLLVCQLWAALPSPSAFARAAPGLRTLPGPALCGPWVSFLEGPGSRGGRRAALHAVLRQERTFLQRLPFWSQPQGVFRVSRGWAWPQEPPSDRAPNSAVCV